jgi:hypothetical protein
MRLKLPRLDRYSRTAVALGTLGVVWRISLTAVGAPPTNSDEATMGLASVHVNQGREMPIYFYGQHYMGTIEAYLSAPLVAMFGPSVAALRTPTTALYVALLILSFVMVRRVYTAGLAVVVVGLLACGADRVVKNQLIAGGGYPETAPMVVGLLLLTWALATARRAGLVPFAGWGLLLGLIAWNHWLPAPFLLGALVLLITARVLTRQRVLAATAGFLTGLAPLLVDNLTAGLSNNSVAVFAHLNSVGSNPPLWDRIVGGAWQGIPLGMGLCAPGRCDGWSLWWAPVLVALLMVAIVLAVRNLRRAEAVRAHAPAVDAGHDRWTREAMSLLLAGAGLLSLISYVRSPAAADTPIESARYLSALPLSLPAALWPLWQQVRARRWRAAPAAAPIGALALTMLAATASLAAAIRDYARMSDEKVGLVTALERSGISYVHSEYWTCNWISYLSAERVLCGVVKDDLSRGFNRYPGYWREHAQARIAPVGSALDLTLARRAGIAPSTTWGYHVYPADDLLPARGRDGTSGPRARSASQGRWRPVHAVRG